MSSSDEEVSREPAQSSESLSSSVSSDEFKSMLLQYVTSPQKWRDCIKILILVATFIITVFSVIAAYMGLTKIDQVSALTQLLYSLTTTAAPQQ